MERALYNYIENIKKLKDLREEILDGTSSGEPGMPRGGTLSNTTEVKAIQLAEDRELKRLTREIERAEQFLKKRSKIEKQIIELKFFRHDLNNKEIMEILGITPGKFYIELRRIRDEFI